MMASSHNDVQGAEWDRPAPPLSISLASLPHPPHPRLCVPSCLASPIRLSPILFKEDRRPPRMSISNLQTFDAFADAEQEDIATKQSGAVHVRIQQRNGRKTLTTVQGLSPEIDYQKLLRAFKKSFNTNGSITEHPEHGSCIQLQGDQRFKVAQFLEEEGLVAKDKLKIHGF